MWGKPASARVGVLGSSLVLSVTASAILRALGLPDAEIAELATRALPKPSIEPGTLLWRLISGREG